MNLCNNTADEEDGKPCVTSVTNKLDLPLKRSFCKITEHFNAWLAQLGERRFAEREVAGSNPGQTNTQGL